MARKPHPLDVLLGRAGKRPEDLASASGVSLATVNRRRAGRHLGPMATRLIREALRAWIPTVRESDLDAAVPEGGRKPARAARA